MLLINDCFQTHVFDHRLQGFLLMLKRKAVHAKLTGKGCRTAVLDELYGITPPFKIVWHLAADKEYHRTIKEWGLAGVMELTSEWDRLHLKFWQYAGKFHCVFFKFLNLELEMQTEPGFLPERFIEIFQLADRRLRLIRSALSNPVLKSVGVRNYICDFLQQEPDVEKRYFLMELFVTLLELSLTREEETNQEIFRNRAHHYLRNIILSRAESDADESRRAMAGSLALRGCGQVEAELATPISMVWGFLANQKHFASEIEKSPEPARYCERYFSDGRVEIGEITPAARGEKSELISLPRYDLYAQVFPDYETAMMSRNAALDILRNSQIK